MPLMKGRDSFTANQTIANVLQGEDFEFLSQHSLVSVSLSQTAAGGVEATVKADNATLGADLAPNVEAAVGRVIQDEDMVIDQEFVPAGSRLKISATELGGVGTNNLNWMVKVEPIPAGMV